MRVKNYSTLKAASKVSFAKVKDSDNEDIIQLTEKRFDSHTGEALSDSVHEVELDMYKNDKSTKEAEKVTLETDITELGKIITDIEAL
tara:strand:+ start:49 stop:312 length:264 start_codon:yes stop_codon:yes gene_type:complete